MKGKIFNAQEVQAIIAGNKTQFREVCKRQPSEQTKPYLIEKRVGGFSGGTAIAYPFGEPTYQVGQKIFCKESFSKHLSPEMLECHDESLWYWAKGNPEFGDWTKPKPAQHMKQEHSRLTLQIKEIRVERLADISEEDAILEGFKNGFYEVRNVGDFPFDAYDSFAKNWNATHKKPEEKFEASPFVWCVSFEIINN